MRLLPRTLFGQMLLALFAWLIAAQSLGFWLMLDDRVRFGERLLGAYAAQRMAGVISILDRAEPAERARLLHELNVPPIRISLNDRWHSSPESGSKDAHLFIEHVARELERPAPLQVLSIKREKYRRGEPPILFVVGQARLADGAVLTFWHNLPQQGLDWPLRLLVLLVVLGMSVAILAGWTVRPLIRPLASLADAATGLAQNLEQSPLPENGPLEVSRAAQAFNAMQRALKRYLEARALALAAVSHDLRLPITRLRLRLERVSDEDLKTKMEEDLAEMDDMIGSTLEFLRAGSSAEKWQKLDVNALLESVAGDMAMVGAQVELHGTASGPITAKPQALRRCLANLLDNAWRYGSEHIDVSIAEHGDQLEIRVEDRGAGISREDLERVFEPYVRIESSRAKHTGGTGLGLAIARVIARAHGGDVRLSMREGGGTCATIALPRKKPEGDAVKN